MCGRVIALSALVFCVCSRAFLRSRKKMGKKEEKAKQAATQSIHMQFALILARGHGRCTRLPYFSADRPLHHPLLFYF